MDHDLFIIHGVEENPPQGKTWDPVKRNISKLWGMHGYQDDSRGPQKHGWPHTISLPFAAGCNQLSPYITYINYHVQDQLCEWGQNQNPNFTKRQKYEYYALQSLHITTNQCMMKETLLGMGQGQALICFLSTLTWVNCLSPKNGMPGSWHSSMTNAPFYFACYTWYNPE